MIDPTDGTELDPDNWGVRAMRFKVTAEVNLERRFNHLKALADVVLEADFTDRRGDHKSAAKVKVVSFDNVREIGS